MCYLCGCGAAGDFMSGGDGVRPSDDGVLFRVVEPGVRVPNYVMPGMLTHEREVGAPQPSGSIAADARHPNALVQPGLPDGRIAQAGVARGATGEPSDPSLQAAWGFGLAKAAPQPGESAAGLLTVLPEDPVGFSARQQDAVRRDMGDRLVDYYSYAPVPFAAQDPLTGRLAGGFDLLPPASAGGMTGPGSVVGARGVVG